MERINLAISQYQQRIGKFDRQVWEPSVEQEVLKKLRSVPRKTAKVNQGLIDVDLFGGSSFSRPKPQYGWLAVSRRAILRVIFFPLYQRWWRSSTSGWVFTLLCLLYILQVGSLIICVTDPGQSLSAETLSVAHMASPCIMIFVLALVHSQIMAFYELSSAHYTQLQAKNKKNKIRSSKRKTKASGGSERESTGSHDTGIYLNPDDIDAAGPHCTDSYSQQVTQNVPQDIAIQEEASRTLRRSSLINRRTSIEKTSAWLQQQSSKQCNLDTETTSDICFDQFPKSSSTLTSKSDICKNSILSSRSEPSLCTFVEKSNSDLTDLTKSSIYVVSSKVSEDISVSHSVKTDVASEVLSGSHIKDKSRQLRFCCIIPDRPEERRQSVPNVRSHDKATREAYRLSASLTCRPDSLLDDANCVDTELCCASATSLNDTEDPSPQDDAVSIANSNTSMSDTCNSSLKSSTEDLVTEMSRKRAFTMDNGSPVSFTKPCCHHHHNHHHHNTRCHMHSYGHRQRKRSSVDCSVRNHLSTVYDNKRISPESLLPDTMPNDMAGLETDSHCFQRNKATCAALPVDDTPSVPASTDEEASPLLRVSPSKGRPCHHTRPSRSTRCPRLGDVCSCCSGSVESTKDRKDGRRCNGGLTLKVNDIRLLESTGVSSGESDGESAQKKVKTAATTKIATSEWEDTVNTEMTSGSISESSTEHSSSHSDLSEKDILGNMTDNPTGQGIQHVSSVMNNLASSTDRVSCMIWEPNTVHKVDLTVLDIGWTIIQKVDKMPETCDYLVLGIVFSLIMMFVPTVYRIYHSRDQLESLNYHELAEIYMAAKLAFGHNWRQIAVIINGMLQRLWLSLIAFFLLSVGERTFKQRLLYAKNFSYLTSSRRAKKYELPHFRLNKVRNIKTWLSLRSFLKKRGPQRSVEIIVSAAFLLAIILVSILCIELLQDYGTFLDHLGNWELVMWCMCLGVYLLRFITLGTKINKKYRNFSVLITEQINLYLHMEQKPHKKEELMVANSVLKLAEDLLKELESPFKISGLSANPFLYNITKVVVLSAFSAVLTELLGFKLKLYKIKIRA